MNRLLLAALVALLAPSALAQTCTTSWTNASGGVWETAANWNNGVPGAGSVACITLAGTYTVAQSSADRTIAGLVVGGASGTQTLTTFNRFTVTGNSVVRPSGRWELLDRTPGGSDGFLTTGTATIEGVFVQNGGTTLLDGGGTLDIAPGGRWEMRAQASAGITARPGTFRLRGTLDAAYTSTQTVEVPLDVQGGTVRVSQGRLDVRGGVLANATVDAAAGATLLLISSSAAPFTVSGTLSGAPAGEVFFNGGTFAATSGEVTLALGGTGLLLGGSVNLTSGGGTFLNTGRLTHAETGSNFAALNGTTLRNTGRFVMPGRGFGFQNGGVVRNEASGVIEIANGGGLGGVGGAAGRVENAGLIVHTANSGAGTGTTGTIGVPYTGLPGSTLRLETGRLDLQAGGSFRDATFDVPAATVMLLSSSAPFVAEGTLGGNVQGDLQINTELRAAASGVTLAFGGTGLLATRGTFNAVPFTTAGGSFRNTGLLRTGGLGLALQQVVFENTGTVRIGSTVQLQNGSVLRNAAGATVEATGSSNVVSGDGRFENAGLLLKASAGASNFGGQQLRSLPGSEIRVLAGRLDLQAPGSRTLPAGTALTGTAQVLFGTDLEPEGTVSPGTDAQPLATLSSFNGYRPSLVAGSPRLVIDVDAGGQSDVLATGGGTRLGGALVVRVRPGYTPAVGEQWTVLTNGTSAITGQFSQVVADGAPPGIAFVTEGSADGTALILRAVAAAPGGAITVSATALVGGGSRALFLTGPGASGVSAARLECSGCLDAAAFGTIPATLSGSGSLREARLDLTSARVVGRYDVVLTQPGLADVRVPVTIRPYLAFVVTSGGVARGARVRPPGQGYNYSTLQMGLRTNAGQPAYHAARVVRTEPNLFSLALATGNPFSSGVVYFESDDAADPTRTPVTFGRLTTGAETPFTMGLRISPENVRFPEQPSTGPDDPRIPFGTPRLVTAAGPQHLSADRMAAVLGVALRQSGNGALTAYLAQVDAAEPAAVGDGTRNTIQFNSGGYYAAPAELLGRLLTSFSATVAAPPGLAAAAADAFDRAYDAAVTAASEDIETALVDAINGGGAVGTLVQSEINALFPEGTGFDGSGGEASRSDYTALERLLCFFGFGESIRSIKGIPGGKPGGGGGGACEPPAAPADPNDKVAETVGFCEFGTVVVDGENVTRCVRHFVPLAEATRPLSYTVSFENLPQATANAEFVTITDEIDPNLNLASLRIESTSSDSTFSYSVSGRTVTFRFSGIDLPPNVTAPEGEGYVRFSLAPVAGLPEGTEIRNDAQIVFDFNPPIQTPEVVHQVRRTLDLGLVVSGPSTAEVGRPATFEVAAANLRGDAAAEATFTVSAPGAVLSDVTPSAGTCVGTAPAVCTVTDLAAGSAVTVAFTVTPQAAGVTVVSATAATAAFDAFTANDTDGIAVTVTPVGTEADPAFPRELTLSSPWPNPARGAATLRWGLPAAAAVDVRVYDLLGREVARIADEAQPAGWHEAQWDAQVASGVYVVRVRVGDDVRTRRMTVIR